MPNTKSAKKALRQSEKKYVGNLRKKRSLRRVLKDFERVVDSGNKSDAEKVYTQVQKTLDKSAKANIIKKNTASRKKSRLAAQLKKLG